MNKGEDLPRRGFIEAVLAAGGAAAVGVACAPDGAVSGNGVGGAGSGSTSDDTAGETGGRASPFAKDPSPFIQHPTNLETRLEDLHGVITPNELFFVRNHTETPEIDASTYRLRIGGEGVEEAVELTYDDLRALPTRSVIAYLECAGNWRSFWARVMGRVADGGQWGTGGVGCAEWNGVRLSDVLDLAGLRPDAIDVNLIGMDVGDFNRPMPVSKALEPTTLLAWGMNGETLPPDHGFPIRGVVPGWVGSNSVKWVGEIQVSTEKLWVKNTTTSYVLVGDDWPAEDYAPADGGPVTLQTIKSALALPWPANLTPGPQRLPGFAYSPHGRIAKVEWRVDSTGPWRNAELLDPVLEYAWARFEFVWDASPGEHVVEVRATDEAGNTQPDTVPFNQKGYLLNTPLPHPVVVV